MWPRSAFVFEFPTNCRLCLQTPERTDIAWNSNARAATELSAFAARPSGPRTLTRGYGAFMSFPRWILVFSCFAAALPGCGSEDPMTPGPPVVTEPTFLVLDTIASGLATPVDAGAPAGDDRLFVAERAGRIRIIRDGQLGATPFLDITDRVQSNDEQGLLGMAFAPDFASSGHFFVHYTMSGGDSRISRFGLTADADVADAGGEDVYLEVGQPFPNHNGGQVAFGPDGFLYIALGDGGGSNDPLDAGQDRTTVLGTLLRIDVSDDPPYRIPADNPFVSDALAQPEIWAWGLRNPWRFSFDDPSSTLLIADVGQNRLEEINAVAADAGGVNYGWNTREGNECFQSPTCDTSGLTDPVLVYDHQSGCSVTGGHVYRGTDIPDLEGLYLYSDFCSGWIRTFALVGGQATDPRQLDLPSLSQVTSFGVDAQGEMYVLTGTGRVIALRPAGGA